MTSEAKESIAMVDLMPTNKKIAKVLADIRQLDDYSKSELFKYLWALYPVEISTYARLKSAIRSAASAYKGGFFGISVRRKADIAAVHKLCDKLAVKSGRSVDLAYSVYEYATQKIATGFLGRSDLRDKLVFAIESVDPCLAKTLRDLRAKGKLTLEAVKEIMSASLSLIHLPPEFSECSDYDSDEDRALPLGESLTEAQADKILEGYRRSVE